MNENIIRTISSEMNRYLNNYQMSNYKKYYKKVEIEKKEISNDEYVNKFINSKRLEGCSELTIKNYKIHISKMLLYLDKDVRTIETNDIRDFLSFYQSNNKCNGVRRLLSSFFTFLEVEDYIVKSPIRRIHKIKTEFLIKETYSDELMERLRDSCTNVRNLAIIDLLASSGIRISELVNLNRDDINFENKSCLVFGKGRKMRVVYSDGKAKLHMEEYLNNRIDNSEALFVSNNKPHERLQSRGIELMLQKLGKELGEEKVHSHKFRRTLATKAIDKGIPIEQVQHLLGHTKIDTTLHYTFVNQNNVKISHRKYIC